MIMKVIYINGPSGSGKTTIASELSKNLRNVFVLNTDNYYKTGINSKILSLFIGSYFDRTISLNYNLLKNDLIYVLKEKKATHSYTYNFKNKKISKEKTNLNNIKFLIIEGIFSTEFIKFAYLNKCYLINLKTSKKDCLKRILERDQLERGKSENKIKRGFFKGWEIYQKRELKRYDELKIKTINLTKNFNINYILNRINQK